MTTKAEMKIVDRHVGARMHERRLIKGMSQEELGAAVNVSFQQQQKREHGTNRVSASALYFTARILGVPVEYFFEGMEDEPAIPVDAHGDREILQLVRYYREIKNPADRKPLFNMVKAVAMARQ